MKKDWWKYVLVIGLCVLNLTIIIPWSISSAKTTVIESYGVGAISVEEAVNQYTNLGKIQTGIKIFTSIILLVTIGTYVLIDKKEEETIEEKITDDKMTPLGGLPKVDYIPPASQMKEQKKE